MGKRRKRSTVPLKTLSVPERKRSWDVPWMWVGAAVLIGFPMLRDATADRMLRNRYVNQYSCECDYGQQRCRREGGQWLGPWYASDPAKRAADDPGHGGTCPSRGSTGGYVGYRYVGGTSPSDYEPSRSVERGYRGGFGGTGRVRAAGS
jgi:hypothetical protein